MTIAIGFKCVDGVVLAADSQYSDGTAKLSGSKIFPIPSNGYYALTIAGSGGVQSIKGIVREIEKRLQNDIGANTASISDLRGSVENALGSYYPKHIDSAPKNKRQDLEAQLLIAMWIPKHGTRLFETYRIGLTEVQVHRSIGFGSYLVEYLKDLFFPPGLPLPVNLAKPLAAYMVAMAKKYVEYCGGWTSVRALLKDGSDDGVWRPEIRLSEKYIKDLFQSLAYIWGYLGAMPPSVDIDMEPWAKLVKDRLAEFKRQQKECRDAQTNLGAPKPLV